MQTYEEQQAFFNSHWEELKAALERGGAAEAGAFVMLREDELERRVLFIFGLTAINHNEWQGKNLDDYMAFADAGIAECLRQAAAAGDIETSNKRTDSANVISYNVSAGLADCWEDNLEHLPRHFERGLQAARDCIRWRLELDKGAWPFAIAYWARGMHQLSLGELPDAIESFRVGLEFSRTVALESGQATTVGADADFGVNLATGYLGLARSAAGQALGAQQYAQALAAFTAQLADEKTAEDAQFGLDQLRTVEQRYLAQAAA